MIRRTDLTDFLVVDGESVAILNETVYRLGHVATAILDALAEPTTLPALATTLEAQFGAPPSGSLEDAVRSQLDELAAVGLVSIDS
ncbi:PqqD family peptide modification chaperone [Tessaracoccus flavus]|uniref:Uncharacterized protein n=1 Tax=Tessaracoccus flavus TaxID=1610493 RepID=A0A1Q2CHG6_9ACTN|nr:PqqD family peptide modification chaperone [Tessaracoccus flavus]AQP45551.1 hypothetical protein RPIT_12660 [Tessaracoccus flavus]SDY79281.1 Coenzyme PQQ synthesis protein D (PqqD) [Tessaracoccus flavus]